MTYPRFRLTLKTAFLLIAGAVSALGAEDYSITTFAGAANVTTGADGTPGSFNNPYGVAIDSAKNVYVADTLNNTIRKITPGGVVSTLAGTAGQFGATDATGSAARFNFPVGIAVDSAGNVYVADSKNFTIRKITPAGVVTTFAGATGQPGANDGSATTARFFLPFGVAVDGAGNVYVADSGNQVIRKISPDGNVSTLAGTAGQPGFVNGAGTSARFSTPLGVSVDSSGNVFVADSGNHAIRRITAGGTVTTVAGSGTGGAQDGPGPLARFNQPRGVTPDASGNLLVADYGNSTIRHITPNGTVSTIAGSPGIVGEVNSVGLAARFYEPIGIVVDGAIIYVADSSNNSIRRGQPASTASVPVISIQPVDQEVSVGQSVSFSVALSGSGVTFQWLQNGTIIPGATSSTYTIPSAQVSHTAAYSVRVTQSGTSVDSQQGTLSVFPVGSGPVVITARPLGQSVNPGQRVTFNVTATGSGLTYQWLKDGGVIPGATSPSYTIASAQGSDAGTYSVRVTSGAATEAAFAKLVVGGLSGSGLSINAQPASQVVDAGRPVTFSVNASGTTALTYQWLKNDVAIPGATATSYTLPSVQQGDVGSYSVRVSGGGQNVTSSAAVLALTVVVPVGPTSRLSNLSVRTAMAAGQTLIVGTFVDGGGRDILVRAAGPGLAAFGLAGAMTDPRLELYNGTTLAFSNEDWAANLAPTFASVGAFAFPANSRDAAFVQNINGGRSIQARGTGGGVVLVEAYDLGQANTPRMVNVSARNRVGTGDDILIAGFNIAGTGAKQVLIRAVGPKLAAFGVDGTLVDPVLELYNSASVKITENDNWATNLTPTFTAVGAFQLDPGSRDAALVTTLTPGSYTVQVRGANNGVGEALIEIYEVAP